MFSAEYSNLEIHFATGYKTTFCKYEYLEHSRKVLMF